jgi:hypothetical protein
MSDVSTSAPASATPSNPGPDNTGAPPAAPSGPDGTAKPGDIAAAAKEAMRKLKYKTKEGTDAEVDEAEALKVYMERKQHQAEASRTLNEGKALRKQSEELLQMLKDEGQIKAVLKKLGHDDRKLAEKILAAHLEDELMDPKDRELRNLKAEIARREEMDRSQKEELQKKMQAQRVEVLRQKYEKEFLDTLEASKLPKTKQTVARMAGYIAQCARIGYEITPNEAAKLLAEDLRREHKAIIDEANIDSLIGLYGEENIKKLRQYDSARVKNPESGLRPPQEQALPRDRSKPKKRMSVREWQLHKRGLK